MQILQFLVLILMATRQLWGETGGQMSIIDEHQKIDAAAAPDRIKTEDDALAYIDEITKLYQFTTDDLNRFEQLRKELAHAEFQAINHHSGWISPETIAQAYNKLVDAYGIPGFHIGAAVVQDRRRQLAFLYPHMFGRKPDGSIEPMSRPVEAVYVLFLLDYNAQFPSSQSRGPNLHGDDELPHRIIEYRKARIQFLSTHSQNDIESLIHDLLLMFGLNITFSAKK